jgi:single-strand DNA-binding protein
MANGVNKVILIGNLGKDPETQTFESGVKKTSFPLATSEEYKDKEGNKIQQTEWHNIVLWRGLAEVAEKYLSKGNSVYIEGKIKTRSWEDKDGNKRYTTEIVGDNMTMLGSKKPPNGNDQEEDKSDTGKTEVEDDLPF